MDLDHIRAMVAAGDFRHSDKFDQMIQARDFMAEQAVEVLMSGRVVDEEPARNRPTRYVIRGNVERECGAMDWLDIELAVTDVSGYWPGDGHRKRK